VDKVKKLIDGRSGRKVANVDGASSRIVRAREGCGKSGT
jgi:hypothetical protein